MTPPLITRNKKPLKLVNDPFIETPRFVIDNTYDFTSDEEEEEELLFSNGRKGVINNTPDIKFPTKSTCGSACLSNLCIIFAISSLMLLALLFRYWNEIFWNVSIVRNSKINFVVESEWLQFGSVNNFSDIAINRVNIVYLTTTNVHYESFLLSFLFKIIHMKVKG